ncbi:MAG: TIGR03750 family conjugal transfer protein [Candidatus Competibacteraceae bacterium]|nr:TIGR03750 family conjugal transfer protein [Candidatus Competibacteraceae bacterium]
METLRTDRLNREPPIFKGCSSTELGLLALAGSLFWLPVGLLLAWLAGVPALGLGLAVAATVVTTVLGTGVVRQLKRGRPDGYYWQKLMITLHDRRWHRSPFIRVDGPLDLGRRTRLH